MSDKVNKSMPHLQNVNLAESLTEPRRKGTNFLKKSNKKTLSEHLSDVSGGFDDRYRFYYPEDD